MLEVQILQKKEHELMEEMSVLKDALLEDGSNRIKVILCIANQHN